MSEDLEKHEITTEKKVFEKRLAELLDRQLRLYGVDPNNPQEVTKHCTYGKVNGVMVYCVDDQPVAYIEQKETPAGISFYLYSVNRDLQ